MGYVDGLEQFLKEYEEEMSEEQKKHVETLIRKTKTTVPMIDEKIEQKVGWREFDFLFKKISYF